MYPGEPQIPQTQQILKPNSSSHLADLRFAWPGTWESLCSPPYPSSPVSHHSASYLALTLHLSSSPQSQCHCFCWGQGLLIFLQGCCLSSACLAFGHVSFQTFVLQLPAWSIQSAALISSPPCLRSTGASLLPNIVLLKVWSPDQQHQHHQELVRNAHSQALLLSVH